MTTTTTKPKRLSDDRRELAAQWFRLAMRQARQRASRYARDLGDELESSAGEALCHVALAYDERRAPFPSLLAVCVARRLADELPAEMGWLSRRQSFPCDPAASSAEQGEERQAEKDEAEGRLGALLALLPPRDALALRLVRLEGLTLTDAGLLLGLSREGVRQTIERAMARLRAYVRTGDVRCLSERCWRTLGVA